MDTWTSGCVGRSPTPVFKSSEYQMEDFLSELYNNLHKESYTYLVGLMGAYARKATSKQRLMNGMEKTLQDLPELYVVFNIKLTEFQLDAFLVEQEANLKKGSYNYLKAQMGLYAQHSISKQKLINSMEITLQDLPKLRCKFYQEILF